MESYRNDAQSTADMANSGDTRKDSSVAEKECSLVAKKDFEQLSLPNGKLEFPDWARDATSILWIPIRAIDDKLARGSSSGAPQRESIVDGMRTIALKLEFGISNNQIYDRTIALHFTDTFHVSTRVADQCNDGSLLLQVTLHSHVKVTLTVYDAWLDLQDGFVHAGQDENKGQPDSILNIRYGITGDRTIGAHPPVPVKSNETEDTSQDLIFRSALVLQQPVLDPCLAVGFLSLPSDGLQVGQHVTRKWRVERLKDVEEKRVPQNNDEMMFEVNANCENWMIAGRKRGHVSLATKQGSRIVISILCMPLISGYVHPPHLGLPDIDKAKISCNPAGPHLVCILPPALSSSFCIPP